MCKRVYLIISHSLLAVVLLCAACKKNSTNLTAFYYWKTNFQLDKQQGDLLRQAALNNIYIRFFDVNWDNSRRQAYPNAVVQFKQPVNQLHITPVIYITNKTFENLADTAVNSLALHCYTMVNKIAAENRINYSKVQVDCDWTLTTRGKYFSFLVEFKKLDHHQLQATVRLHQVKYKERTGVPPVDGGVLMFYNMGKFNADPHQPNSIYNKADADKYVASLKAYPLKLDIALPLFSWAIHIRDGRVIQVYGKIGRAQLADDNDFESMVKKNNYRAKRSFFLAGIYIKQNDIFKLEEINGDILNTAAKQLVNNLSDQPKRTIIYYELANIDLREFKVETIRQVSDHF